MARIIPVGHELAQYLELVLRRLPVTEVHRLVREEALVLVALLELLLGARELLLYLRVAIWLRVDSLKVEERVLVGLDCRAQVAVLDLAVLPLGVGYLRALTAELDQLLLRVCIAQMPSSFLENASSDSRTSRKASGSCVFSTRTSFMLFQRTTRILKLLSAFFVRIVINPYQHDNIP